MALDALTNFAQTTVSTGYSSAATSVVLSAGGGLLFPAVPFNAVWWNSTDYANPAFDPSKEIVRVTAISTDTLTITRAQEGTSASNKNTATKTYSFQQSITAKIITDIDTVKANLASPTFTGTSTFPLAGINGGGAGAGDVPVVLYRTSTIVTLNTSTAATDLVTVPVPANSLGTAKRIYFVVVGDFLNNTGGSVNITPAISYGSTTIWSSLVAQATGANRHQFRLEAFLYANAATNSQTLNAWFLTLIGGSTTTGLGAMSIWSSVGSSANITGLGYGTAAEDSTTALNLKFTWTFGTSSSSAEVKMMHADATLF